MCYFFWFLFVVIFSLFVQVGIECCDIYDCDLWCMCNVLECGDSGDCGDIDSCDLWCYCGVLLVLGQCYDCDDICDGDMCCQCCVIVCGDCKCCDDIDSCDMCCQCWVVVLCVLWQCDGIDDCDMCCICWVILLCQMLLFVGVFCLFGFVDFVLGVWFNCMLRCGMDSLRLVWLRC